MRSLIFSIIFALPLFAAATISAKELEESPSNIGYKTPAEALDALRKKPGVTIREENDWYVLHDSSENTFWSITQPANPAHPSAVKRTLVKGSEGISMQMGIICGAPKDVCDGLVKTFQDLNSQISEKLRQQDGN